LVDFFQQLIYTIFHFMFLTLFSNSKMSVIQMYIYSFAG